MSSVLSHSGSKRSNKGGLTSSLDLTSDILNTERSSSISTFGGHSLVSSASTRSEGANSSFMKKSENRSMGKISVPWLTSLDSNDLGIVPEEKTEEELLPTFVQNVSQETALDASPNTRDSNIHNENVWYEIKDAKSKRLFYFNEATQVSQWERPPNELVIPINQKGVAIIRGNGIIEKEYLSACSRLTNAGTTSNTKTYLNEEGHVVDPLKRVQAGVFGDSTVTGDTSPHDSDISPTSQVMRDSHHVSTVSYEDYVNKHFILYRRGLFHSKTSKKNVMSYKSTPIKMPLLKCAHSVSKQAVALNKEILNYFKTMADHSNLLVKQMLTEYVIIQSIVGMVMDNYRQLRDEVYCQVMKAMENSTELITSYAWNIMAILAGSIAPTEELFYYIYQLCQNARTNRNYHSLPLITSDLLKTRIIMKKREAVPTNVEITAILNNSTVSVRVYLDRNSYVTIKVSPSMTIKELRDHVAIKLHITKNAQFFRIYERTDEMNETRLDDDIEVLDRIGIWQKQYYYNRKMYGKEVVYHFVFRTYVFFDIDKTNKPILELLYIQAQYDVRCAHYPCTRMDIITLLALNLKARFGDTEISDDQFIEAIKDEVPDVLQSPSDNAYIFDKLKEFCSKLRGRDREWYLSAYMEYVMSWELYGTIMIEVESVGRNDFGKVCILAVGMHGVFILNPDTNMILRQVPFDSIPSWAYTDDTIVLSVGTFVRQEKMLFKTKRAKEINELLKLYVDFLSEDTADLM